MYTFIQLALLTCASDIINMKKSKNKYIYIYIHRPTRISKTGDQHPLNVRFPQEIWHVKRSMDAHIHIRACVYIIHTNYHNKYQYLLKLVQAHVWHLHILVQVNLYEYYADAKSCPIHIWTHDSLSISRICTLHRWVDKDTHILNIGRVFVHSTYHTDLLKNVYKSRRIYPLPANFFQFEFSPTWSCVSLTRSTT